MYREIIDVTLELAIRFFLTTKGTKKVQDSLSFSFLVYVYGLLHEVSQSLTQSCTEFF